MAPIRACAFSDADLEAAAELVRRLAEALAPLEDIGNSAAPARRSGRASPRRAGGFVARRRNGTSPLSGPTAPSLPMRSTNWRSAKPPPAWRSNRRTMSSFLAVRVADRVVRRAAARRRARAHPRPAGSAADRERSRRARRPGRRRLAAGEPHRSLAQPADAARARARSAGAAHRPFGARFRADARRARGDPDAAPAKLGGAPTVPSRFMQRLAAVAGEARWKAALERGDAYLAWARELDRPEQRQAAPRPAPRPPRAARPTAPLRHRDRALAARSLHDLRQARSAAWRRSTPSTRRPAPPTAAPSSTARIGEFTERFADEPARRSGRRADRARREAFRAARGLSRGARLLVAALSCASRAGSPAGRRGAAPSSRTARGRDRRRDRDSARPIGAFKLTRRADRIERMPTAAMPSSTTRPARRATEKQVRTGLAPQLTLEAAILRQGGFNAASPAGGSVARAGLCRAARRRARPARSSRSTSRTARPTRRPTTRCESSTELARRFDDENEPYRSLVHPMWTSALRRLRPSRARQGMVGDRRRRRRHSGRANERAAQTFRPTCCACRRAASDPARFGLGRGQCRLRQDPRAGAARDPSAARRRRAGENPLHHLHQGRRRQHGEPRVRHARATGRRSTTRRSTRRSRNAPARAPTPRAARWRGGCSPRAGDAGRAEGADHPRLLHAAAAPVSVRGQRRRALRRARRDRSRRSCWSDLTLDVLLEGAPRPGQPARPRARHGDDGRRPTRRSATSCAKRSASATRSCAWRRCGAGGVDEAIAELSRRARHRAGRHASKQSRRNSSTASLIAGTEWAAIAAALARRSTRPTASRRERFARACRR